MDSYRDEREGLDLRYFNETFVPTNTVFDYLKGAKINLARYEQYKTLDTTGHILSFEPDENGYAQRVQYDRVSTVTGRLKTIAGPMLLHLPKVYRAVLESRWGDDGSVVALDYKSLEPRVLLSTCGRLPIEEEQRDIYEHIRSDLFSGSTNIIRDIVKKIVLSELYGAGVESIRERLKGVEDVESIINQISDWFQLKTLRTRLHEEWISTGSRWITNYYGRRVRTENTHTLVNHYIQSTAVDVALFGFKNILNYLGLIGRLSDIVPLFILHDAIIFDVHQNAFSLINGLSKVGATDIQGFEQRTFYMSIDKEFTKP